MRLDTSGNVGIGVTNPANRLSLPNANYLGWKNSTNTAETAGILVNALDKLVLYNGADRVTVDSSGNVGIGTTSPASAASKTFTVQNGGGDGSVSITAGDYSSAASLIPMVQTLGNRYDGNTTFGGRFAASFRRSDGTAIASGHNLGYYAFGGQWGTDTTYQSAKLLYAAAIIGVAEGSFTSATAMPTAITFCTGSTGGAIQTANTAYGTERMRIDSSGNVLIGSAASAGNTLRYLDIYNTDTGAFAGAIIRLVTSNAASSGNTTVDIVKYKTGGFIINNNETNAAAYTGFNVGASERMRIDSSGNVGIGLTNPSAALQVFRSGSTEASIKFNNGNASSGFVVGASTAGEGLVYHVDNQPIRFATNNTERMRIDSSGNVGVGLNNTGAYGKFGVGGTSYQSIFVQSTDASGTIGVLAANSSSEVRIGAVSNHPVAFYTNNTERMRIDTAGIVTMNAYGAGAATFSAAGVISSVSDETWKIKDGVPVDPDAMLKKLEPGYWYYNDEKKEIFGVDRQLGFYAQNVNAAIGPEAAPTPEEGKPWGYYDRSVLAVTVMSLQKALATIESLTARITALEST